MKHEHSNIYTSAYIKQKKNYHNIPTNICLFVYTTSQQVYAVISLMINTVSFFFKGFPSCSFNGKIKHNNKNTLSIERKRCTLIRFSIGINDDSY